MKKIHVVKHPVLNWYLLLHPKMKQDFLSNGWEDCPNMEPAVAIMKNQDSLNLINESEPTQETPASKEPESVENDNIEESWEEEEELEAAAAASKQQESIEDAGEEVIAFEAATTDDVAGDGTTVDPTANEGIEENIETTN